MALLIQPPVTMTLKFRSFFGWDGWFPALFINIINQLVAVITTVCKHTASFYIYMIQYRYGKIDVIALPFAEHKIYRTAISVYGCMDFGTGTSTAVPDFVWRPPFFAPALCWWAWTIVASSESS